MSTGPTHRVSFPRPARLAEAAAMLAAVGFGWFVAQGGLKSDPPPPAPLPHIVSAEGLRVRTDPTWQRASPAPSVPGFTRSKTVAFRPTPGLDTFVIVQMLPLNTRSLLPPALETTAGKPQTTTFDGRPAWHYAALVAGPWNLDVLAMPTTTGVLTVACAAQEDGQALLGCLDGMRSVDPARGRALRPNADLAFQRKLSALLPGLNRGRLKTGHALLKADGPVGQGAAARRMRTLYRDAAGELHALDVAGPTRELSSALSATGAAYRQLSIAAGHRSRREWNSARDAVRGAERTLALRVTAAQKD